MTNFESRPAHNQTMRSQTPAVGNELQNTKYDTIKQKVKKGKVGRQGAEIERASERRMRRTDCFATRRDNSNENIQSQNSYYVSVAFLFITIIRFTLSLFVCYSFSNATVHRKKETWRKYFQ